jgi:alpha-galactosidase
MTLLARHLLGDIACDYLQDAEGGIGLRLVPAACLDALVAPRPSVPPPGGNPTVRRPDPLAHVQLAGQPLPIGFAAGRTMQYSPVTLGLRLEGQRVERSADGAVAVITTLANTAAGIAIEHRLRWRPGWSWLRIATSCTNRGQAPVRLELLTGAVLGDITPFAADDAPDRLHLHRFRSSWSAEGRHEERSLVDLHLERSWSGHAVVSERYGQVGSMPVRGFVPWIGVEDRGAQVIWALQPDAAASWQCEVGRRADNVSIACGPADREFGHWWVDLAPGGRQDAPEATAVCCRGGIDQACERLVAAIDAGLQVPEVEERLPVSFNEWCTSWGNPSHERLAALADRLVGTGIEVLTIDAGWFLPECGAWCDAQGDWIPSPRLFPHGLAAATAAIAARGLRPGLWFEWEVVGRNSSLWERREWLLHRDGSPITVGDRRFLDCRLEPVREHLRARMLALLRSCGIRHLKMDYNESIGIGADGVQSPAEEMARATAAAQAWVAELRRELPDLVVECCASGGHRLEPSWLRLVAQASFSDIHEGRSIPLVGAALHRLIPVRMNQIWAVLHAADDRERIAWSLAAGLLGRLCVSGDADRLDETGMGLVKAAVAFSQCIAPVLRHGRSRVHGPAGAGSWSHPAGWQAVVREHGDRAFVIVHAFAGSPEAGPIPLPAGTWRIEAVFPDFRAPGSCSEGGLATTLDGSAGDRAGAWVLARV